MSRVRGIGLIAAFGIACVLTSCAPTEEDPAMDHVEAKTEVDALFQAAQELVGGEWESLDSGADPCTLPSGQLGTQFSLHRSGPGVPVEQQQTVLDQVGGHWSGRGFEPFTYEWPEVMDGITVKAMRYPETGYGKDGLAFELAISINGTTLDGQTRCVPGDADEINRLS